MTFDRPLSHTLRALAATDADRRAVVELEEQERATIRQQALATQVSPLNDPQERIRIWERLHELALPKHAGHKLVDVIATQTQLTSHQVQEEQRRRANPAVP